MDLEKLKSFCDLVKSGNLNETENLVKIKYATLRKRVLSLEKEIGIKLTENHDNRLIISSEGEKFYIYANEILGFVEKKLSEFEENKSSIASHITIATTNAIASLWLSDALIEFMKAFPGIRVTVKASDESFDLFKREADVSICSLENVSKNLRVYEITEYNMNLYASEEYVHSRGFPQTIGDLNNHTIIAYGTGVPFPFKEINWHLEHLSENKKPEICINSGGAIFNLVMKGMGIGSVSQKAVSVSSTNLIRILPNVLEGPIIKIGYCFPKTRDKSKTIQILYEYIRNKFK